MHGESVGRIPLFWRWKAACDWLVSPGWLIGLTVPVIRLLGLDRFIPPNLDYLMHHMDESL